MEVRRWRSAEGLLSESENLMNRVKTLKRGASVNGAIIKVKRKVTREVSSLAGASLICSGVWTEVLADASIDHR